MGATPCGGSRPPHSFLLKSEWLNHAEGLPQASRLRQVESCLRDIGMTGLASAWAMASRRTKEYRRKVDAATRCSGVCPHTWPDLTVEAPKISRVWKTWMSQRIEFRGSRLAATRYDVWTRARLVLFRNVKRKTISTHEHEI